MISASAKSGESGIVSAHRITLMIREAVTGMNCDNGRGVAAEPDLMILPTDASATPPLTAARCSVQIGRTGAIARCFQPGFDSGQSECAGRSGMVHACCQEPANNFC